MQFSHALRDEAVHIPTGIGTLQAGLVLPAGATGLVVFAHAARDGRGHDLDDALARSLHEAGLGTLVFAAGDDDAVDLRTRLSRFDIPLLVDRLVRATQWVLGEPPLRGLRVGYFASGVGSAAAIAAAAGLGASVTAVATRGGRLDFAGSYLERVMAATLVIMAGADRVMLDINESAYERLHCTKRLVVVPGSPPDDDATQEEIAALASDWFQRHLEAAVQA